MIAPARDPVLLRRLPAARGAEDDRRLAHAAASQDFERGPERGHLGAHDVDVKEVDGRRPAEDLVDQ